MTKLEEKNILMKIQKKKINLLFLNNTNKKKKECINN